MCGRERLRVGYASSRDVRYAFAPMGDSGFLCTNMTVKAYTGSPTPEWNRLSHHAGRVQRCACDTPTTTVVDLLCDDGQGNQQWHGMSYSGAPDYYEPNYCWASLS